MCHTFTLKKGKLTVETSAVIKVSSAVSVSQSAFTHKGDSFCTLWLWLYLILITKMEQRSAATISVSVNFSLFSYITTFYTCERVERLVPTRRTNTLL